MSQAKWNDMPSWITRAYFSRPTPSSDDTLVYVDEARGHIAFKELHELQELFGTDDIVCQQQSIDDDDLEIEIRNPTRYPPGWSTFCRWDVDVEVRDTHLGLVITASSAPGITTTVALHGNPDLAAIRQARFLVAEEVNALNGWNRMP